MVATRSLRLEEEEAPAARAEQCPGAEVYEVSVLARDGLRAQLAHLLDWSSLANRCGDPDALQHRDRVCHRSATSVGHESYCGLTRRAIGTAGVTLALCSSTTIRVTSGAASKMAASTAPCNVAAEDGHPSQLPRSRSLTAPRSSSTASSSTSPPCLPRKGRTDSSALSTRTSSGSGCRPWTSRRLATSSSAVKSAIRSGARARAISAIRARPAP